VNALVKAIIIGVLESLVRVYQFTRSAISADRDPVLLRRVGNRIRNWVQQSRTDSGVKSDQDRPTDSRKDLHPDQGGVGSDGQHGHNP